MPWERPTQLRMRDEITHKSQGSKKMAADPSGAADGPTTKRLDFKKQSLDDAYAAPANLLEIEVCNAETHGFGRNRYTDYEVKMRVSI